MSKQVFKLNAAQVYSQQLEKLNTEIANLSTEVRRRHATVEETLTSLKVNRQFKRSVPLHPAGTEAKFVKVTHFEEQVGGPVVLFIIPHEKEAEAAAYGEILQKIYGEANSSEISFPELEQFRDHFILAKINDKWCRSRILNYVPSMCTVALEDIDSGVKTIQEMPPHTFQLPEIGEMTKPAYASKVIVENMSSEDSDMTGNYIKIRMIYVNPIGINIAEADEEEFSEDSEKSRDVDDISARPQEVIKPAVVARGMSRTDEQASAQGSAAELVALAASVPEPSREETQPERSGDDTFAFDEARAMTETDWQTAEMPKASNKGNGGAPVRWHKRKTNKRHISEVNYLKVFNMSYLEKKELTFGHNVSLFYVFGGDLNKGLLDVSGVRVENWVDSNKLTFAAMEEDIAEYVESMLGNPYHPQIGELCLAKSEDGLFHRAVCTNLTLNEATMRFIDYGFDGNVKFEEIVKFSLQFIFPCFVHTVDFVLDSGRPVSSIDVNETRKMLNMDPHITAQVKNKPEQPGSYKIVLDDKFVAFQTKS